MNQLMTKERLFELALTLPDQEKEELKFAIMERVLERDEPNSHPITQKPSIGGGKPYDEVVFYLDGMSERDLDDLFNSVCQGKKIMSPFTVLGNSEKIH